MWLSDAAPKWKVPSCDTADSHRGHIDWLTSLSDTRPRRCSLTIRLRFLFRAGTCEGRPASETNDPPHAKRADILTCRPGCWEMARAFLQEAPGTFIPCRPGCCPPACPGHIPSCVPLSLLCSLPARVFSSYSWSAPGLPCRSQLWPRMSLYSSGTRSGSTGLGRKWVNFWCRLDLVPSLGVPSLFNATK